MGETFGWTQAVVITKVYAPQMWSFGLFSAVYSVFGFLGGASLAIYAGITQSHHICLFTAVPVLFFIAQLTRAILRQSMASKLLAEDWPKLKIAAIADITLFWLWSLLMLILILSSVFGRTICWRHRYKLISKPKHCSGDIGRLLILSMSFSGWPPVVEFIELRVYPVLPLRFASECWSAAGPRRRAVLFSSQTSAYSCLCRQV
jgi:hypothetical protein